MPQKVALEIANGSYNTDTLPFSAQRCVNAYPVYAENAAYNDSMVVGTPGITQLTMSGDAISGQFRGSIEVEGILYWVAGTSVFKIFANDTVTNIGTIAAGGRVSMAFNTNYLVIVIPGGNGYTYNIDTDTLAQITDASYITSDSVVFVDGRFVYSTTDGAKNFISDLNDPTSYDALNTFSAEASPDNIVSNVVDHNELTTFGTKTVEFFQNVGGNGQPFQRIGGAIIEKGLHAKFGTAIFDNTICFVGGGINEGSGIWRISSSSSAQKISTNAIDQEIQKFTRDEISGYCFAMSYAKDGAFFLIFTFESIDNRIPSKTFVYDATASANSGKSIWHERQSGLDQSRWRVDSITFAHNRFYVSDYTDSSKVGYLDSTAYQEYGDTMIREVVTQPFTQDNKRVFYSNLEPTLETGVGLNTGQGSDPQIRMSYSDNGGKDYSTEVSRSMGKIGEYDKRVIWKGSLGSAPTNRMFKFLVSDPVKFRMIKLESYIAVGTR